jgi:hypothetical protein
MIFSSVSLFALGVITLDNSVYFYVFMAVMMIMVSPVRKLIRVVMWLNKPKEKPEPVEVFHEKVPERIFTDEELREYKQAKIEATNKLAELNASKSWERSHNVEVTPAKGGRK